MNNSFQTFLERKYDEYQDTFNNKDLARQFIPYYGSDQRITVQFPGGTIKRGIVGATTGKRPCFLLLLTKRSISSSWLLDKKCKIIY